MINKLKISSIAFRQLYALLTVIMFGWFFFIECLDSKLEPWYLPIAFALIWQTLFLVYFVLLPSRFIKIFGILLLMLNAVVFYFMYAYGIAVDKIMFMNVLQTDSGEISDLLNIKILYMITLLGILPSVLIALCRLTPSSGKTIWRTAASSLAIITVLGLITAPQTNLLLHRFKYIMPYLPPINYITGAIDTLSEKLEPHPQLLRISESVKKQPVAEKPNLIVFVVGESSRAANFSLNGYHRPTNAPLNTYLDEIIYYPNVQSCGTATAVSVPCIFSALDRQNYETGSELYIENLTDIFKQAGYKILWKDNDGGCKHICDRVHYEQPCKSKSCPDDILLENLENQLSQAKENQFIVLHTRGSHGPAYYKQYDKESSLYAPVCTQIELRNCSQEELTNAYDNSIHYVSKFLARTIDILKSLQNNYNTVLFYTSDHGESLGEDGIYLHSATYNTAPQTQKQVPMLVWLPQNNDYELSHSCLQKETKLPHSHDNVFHSLIGLARIPTNVYTSKLDIFASCRQKAQ